MEKIRIPVLCTKLYRPMIPKDHVPRTNLIENLGKNRDLPLILVSAPAGYGKSTLVSFWLGTCNKPSAWLSLDEEDNEFRQFLSYFVATVRTIFPEAARETATLINAATLPPSHIIAVTLANELDQIEEPFIVVLDDIHVIHAPPIHNFINDLMRHPSQSMQLILISRRDPAMLPIASLRAGGMLAELRMKELRFTVEESAKFMETAIGKPIEESTASALAEKTEGWITGLRLAALAMQGQAEPDRKLRELKGTTRTMAEYLISEVLDRQPPGIRNCLLSTSILQRFCAPLCDALWAGGNPSGMGKIAGAEFTNWLREHNLFVIPLDTENRWFRYHHLFGDFLKRQLELKVGTGEISALYSLASTWFQDQSLLEESIHYSFAAGNAEAAADIVERYGQIQFEEDRWYVVRRWLDRLPPEIKQERPRLLLLEARTLGEEFRLREIPPVIERVQTLFQDRPADPLDQGELSYFLGYIHFWKGEGPLCQRFFNRALEQVPENPPSYLRAQIELYAGLADLINGKKNEAILKLDRWIERCNIRTGKLWERLRFGLAVIYLIDGDLFGAFRESRLFFDYGTQHHRPYIETWGAYLLGIIAFHELDLTEAKRHFTYVVENRYISHVRAAIDSMVGLAINYQLLGKPNDADRAIEVAHDYARWTQAPEILDVALSGKIRIALLRGDIDSAVRWRRDFCTKVHVPSMIFFLAIPCITECRLLAAIGTEASLSEAGSRLQKLRQETRSLHYAGQMIDIIAIQSLVAHRQGRKEEALCLLKKAVDLASPGKWIRPFIELPPSMANLLQEVLKEGPSTDFARKILTASATHQAQESSPCPLAEQLTSRELEVLELLCDRLQDKEISEELLISLSTVKTHLKHIYQKLGVVKRRQAVNKARALGILR